MNSPLKLVRRTRLPVLAAAFLLLLVAPAAGVGLQASHRSVLDSRQMRSASLERLAATQQPARRRDAYPKLDSRLRALVEKRSFLVTPAGFRPATAGLSTQRGRVRVVIDPARPAEARSAVSRLGGTVEGAGSGEMVAVMPASRLPSLSRNPAVRFVRAPSPFIAAQVPGEEVNASGASAWQTRSLTGKGVKVAIIDGGFAGLADRQASGDLPAAVTTADFCGGGFADGDDHGTAVAEIVHETAPDASLLLACIDSDASLGLAEQWAKTQGAQIINLSGGFPGGRGDGNSLAGAAASDARNSGILWVNAAGNEAQTHWSGTFASADGDKWLDFAPGDEGNSFVFPNDSVICGILKWDEWPVGQSDFDLYLYLAGSNLVIAKSDGEQNGTQPPIEGLCVANETGADADVFWAIDGYSLVSNPRLDLFSMDSPPLQYETAAGSLVDPGTSPAALTVGALCWQSGVLEPYSSQGPTIDGRIKPDIAGFDSVSSATYGGFSGCPSGFAGTSAAAPGVAGAAALVKQKFPAYGPNEIQAFLEKSALDLGAPGKDDQYGSGELRMGEPPDTTAPEAKALPSAGKKGKAVRLMAEVYDDSGTLTLKDIVRRNGRTITTIGWRKITAAQPRKVATNWRAPLKLSGTLQHCVQATDNAGNTSLRSCAKVTLA